MVCDGGACQGLGKLYKRGGGVKREPVLVRISKTRLTAYIEYHIRKGIPLTQPVLFRNLPVNTIGCMDMPVITSRFSKARRMRSPN